MADRIGRVGPVLVWALTIFLALQTAVICVPDNRRQASAPPRAPMLDPRIRTADPAWYSHVPFPRGWRNPVLKVSAAGITLKASSVKMGGRIKAENLGDILTELPLADWPLGRVVVIEGPSTGPGDPQWWNVVDQNLAGAVEVLEAHGVVPYVAAS